jgi:hypothetical protein
MIVPIDSNILACYRKSETANVRVREKDLPVEIIGKFQLIYK